MILFRPVEGEILVGKVLSSNMSGIRVSLEFMEDVWIPSYNCKFVLLCWTAVPDESTYDPVKRIWVWHYRDGEEQLDYEIESGEFIRFRVIAIQYNRVESTDKDMLSFRKQYLSYFRSQKCGAWHRSICSDNLWIWCRCEHEQKALMCKDLRSLVCVAPVLTCVTINFSLQIPWV